MSHTMAHILVLVVNELQNKWDEKGVHLFISRLSDAPWPPATRVWPATTYSTLTCRPTCSARTTCPRAPCPHNFSPGTPQVSPLQHTAPGSQIRRCRLGVGVQYGCHHPPKREDGHGRQVLKAKLYLN